MAAVPGQRIPGDTMNVNATCWRRLAAALAARPRPADPFVQYLRVVEDELDVALAQRDRAAMDRDRLVEVIAGLRGLPPAQVARIYRVDYTGPATDATALLDVGYAQQMRGTNGGDLR